MGNSNCCGPKIVRKEDREDRFIQPSNDRYEQKINKRNIIRAQISVVFKIIINKCVIKLTQCSRFFDLSDYILYLYFLIPKYSLFC